MIDLRLEVELVLVGPILTQATAAGAFGIDAIIARDRLDRPYLPYSLVRGKLRQALEEIQDALVGEEALTVVRWIERWFGPRDITEDVASQRGTLFFSDFVHPHPRPEEQIINRIKIDADTGTAQERMLMMADTPFRRGELAGFHGVVRSTCVDIDQVAKGLTLIRAGLNWLSQLGADRTTGFGRLHSTAIKSIHAAELTPSDTARPALAPTLLAEFVTGIEPAPEVNVIPCRPAVTVVGASPAPTHYSLRIRPRGLLCFAGMRRRANIFDSEEIIPGSAVLGAIATTYCTAVGSTSTLNEVKPSPGSPWQALATHFGCLRVTHALPTTRGCNQRPSALPLSLVVAEPWSDDVPDCLYDVALCSRPRMVPHDGGPRPPVFKSDWKSHVVTKKGEALFGWPDVGKELRVRTAIDPQTGRASGQQLFGYEMVDPEGLDWLATLDLSAVEESQRGPVLNDLNNLLSAGLSPLGKTKVDAEISIESIGSVRPVVASDVQPLAGDRWVITLQTPALLCAPEDLDWLPSQTQTPAEKLAKGYTRVFAELSGRSLELEHFFARQSLSGKRFAGRLPTDGHGLYYPLVPTDGGSTFVLKAGADAKKAQAAVEYWLVHGIPLAASLAERIGGGFKPDAADAWKRCPILNQFGFGEISVNPPWLRGAVPDSRWPIMLED